jgi:SAM-dependent methyltransferase
MWYTEIADLYDAVVQYDEDIPFFIEQCKKIDGPVLELMAGTGRVSVPLLEAGVRLTCVDSSPEMLEILEEKLGVRGLSAKVIQADVRRLDLPSEFPLAIIPFQSFSELVSESDRHAALSNIRKMLSPCGVLICTLHNPRIRLARMSNRGREERRFSHPEGRDEVVLRVACDYDPLTAVVTGTEVIEVYSAAGERLDRREVNIRFSLPDERWFRKAAKEARFSVESLYGDYKCSPFREESSPYMIWVLRGG